MENNEHNYKASWNRFSMQKKTTAWITPEGEVRRMIGFMFNERECRELDYLLRKELDEMIFDLNDTHMKQEVKAAIEQRYKIVFRMYARLASPREISRYARSRSRTE